MLGGAAAYDRLPYFFSDQYDVGMEYSGLAPDWDRVVFRGDLAARRVRRLLAGGDRVVAGMNVNVWDVVDPIQALIRGRVAVDDRRLADPDVPLDGLAPRDERPGARRAGPALPARAPGHEGRARCRCTAAVARSASSVARRSSRAPRRTASARVRSATAARVWRRRGG